MIEKLKMMSGDIVQENIKYIESRFPNVVKEARDVNGNLSKMIDFDALKQELSSSLIAEKKERYEMTWQGKEKAKFNASTPTRATLRPIKEKSVNFDNTENIYIEGDNLTVLKVLHETYLNKIDFIYIDPPYNTGNDFVYKDKFEKSHDKYLKESGQYDEEGNRLNTNTESNGRFHSDWLSMMYPRLKLARDLLSDDGIIFISIDDNEQASLKLLCDEVFGASRFYGELIQLKGNTQNDAKSIQKNHEYILCYSKTNMQNLLTYENCVQKEVFDDSYCLGRDTSASSGHDKLLERPNLGYTVYYIESTINGATGNHNKLLEQIKQLSDKYKTNYFINKDKIIHCVAIHDYNSQKIKEDSKIEDIYEDVKELVDLGYYPIRPPKRKGNKLGCWTWGKDTFIKYWNNNEALIKNKQNIIRKEFVKLEDTIVKNGKRYFIQKNILPMKSIIEINNSNGTTILKGDKGLIPGCSFQNPKSPDLLEYLINNYCHKDNMIVMDFFSGSATTADAVLNYNFKNNTNIHFILVQLEEKMDDLGFKTICDLGEERIRRAGQKIINDNPLFASNLDIGFRVFKLDSSNMKDIENTPEEIEQNLLEGFVDNVKPGRTDLDLLFSVMLNRGCVLSAKIEEKVIDNKKCYIVNDNYIVACFDNNISDDVAKELAKVKPVNAVFRDSSFNCDADRINIEQIIKSVSPSTEVNVI